MGKVVMPKNSAVEEEIKAALGIYYEADDWVKNGDFTDKLKLLIGADQYHSSYTKKVQMTSYFGFTEWEDYSNAQSRRRITESGKRFYLAWINDDKEKMLEEIVFSIEHTVFGRNNCGCSDSDSDVEIPSIFLRTLLSVGYLTYTEFAYLLWLMEDCGKNYTDALKEMTVARSRGNIQLSEEAKRYTDAKPIMMLIRWGLLAEDGKVGASTRIVIPPNILSKYGERLKALKIYNVDKVDEEENKDEGMEEMEEKLPNCLQVKLLPRENKRFPLNQIIYGAPGTGKTYSTAEYALAIINNRAVDMSKKTNEERKTVMDEYNDLLRKGQIVFTTFHQSYGYEEFIQGLRPDTKADRMTFKTVDGVFKRISDIALNDSEHNYVIIIDEINRANISKVFGELITLIEEDKRWGEVNETCATLQSGDIFAVPNNLYIVGTMNSADKSISLIDAALRRRFEFIEQKPDLELIDDAKMRTVLKKMNEKLVNELDSSDLLIGHSYFMNKSEEELPQVLNNSIIPLLYEYFYDNRKKVASVIDYSINGINIEIVQSNLGRLSVRKKENEQS